MFKYKILVLFLSVALLVGCTLPGNIITGSGNVVTQEEAISGFDKVEVSHTFNVDISQGKTFSVVIVSSINPADLTPDALHRVQVGYGVVRTNFHEISLRPADSTVEGPMEAKNLNGAGPICRCRRQWGCPARRVR